MDKNRNEKTSHSFSLASPPKVQRSRFNRSCEHKTTADAGFIIPFFVDEVVAGDTFKASLTAFARTSTFIRPIMDNIHMDVHFTYTPMRLLWDNWERMNGAQDNPGDSTDYLTPVINSGPEGFDYHSIFDYMGIPPKVPDLEINALYARCYNFNFNEWFRDQNLQDSAPFSKGDGPDSADDYILRKRGKRHDYFTSALPWPQKGPSVSLPLGGQATVSGQAFFESLAASASPYGREVKLDTAVNNAPTWAGLARFSGLGAQVQNQSIKNWKTSEVTGLTADLSSATAATINSIREAFQMQKLFERDARGGTRYTEILKSHFGVTAPDYRLQRPEYLGGGSTPVNVNPVIQTSSTDPTTPQGNLSAFGNVSHRGSGFTKTFVEPGIVMGFISFRADLTYQQGLDKKFSRRSRFDYFWPSFSHLGEQAIFNREIYATGQPSDEDVFGYQERYAEYRYNPSRISGLFRSSHPQSLDSWHLSQNFASLPLLNSSFIEESPPLPRVLAVTDEPQFIIDTFMHLDCIRPMPIYSVPGLIDHF